MAIGYEQGEFQPPPPNIAVASVWNGHGWGGSAGPVATSSAVVSCTRRFGCTALGDNNQVYLQRFGKGWYGHPAPNAGSLGDFSCASSTTCVAVGTGTADAWNGKSWRVTRTKPAINLDGVSRPRPSCCIVVGQASEVPSAEQWNGRSWKPMKTPNP
jgi:hypothetical protein